MMTQGDVYTFFPFDNTLGLGGDFVQESNLFEGKCKKEAEATCEKRTAEWALAGKFMSAEDLAKCIDEEKKACREKKREESGSGEFWQALGDTDWGALIFGTPDEDEEGKGIDLPDDKPDKDTQWIWWVIGGVLFLGLIIAVIFLARRGTDK